MDGIVFVDFRRAFDVINHNPLLKKLSVYGASLDRGGLVSIVSERATKVCEARAYKIWAETCQARGTAGINPGSCFSSPICESCAFTFEQLHHWYICWRYHPPLSADWNNITSLTRALSNDLENIEKWSTENKMYINTEQTKALLVTGKRLQHKLSEETATLKLRLDATNIDQLSHHKLLGLIIDKDLSFEAHIDELYKKLSKRLRLLRHVSPHLKKRHKLTFYVAAIKPVMLYLSPIWSSCSKELPERVLRMQKRAARIILDAERTTHTLTMFNELNRILFFIEAYINRCSIAF